MQSRSSATDPEIRLGLFRERGRQCPRPIERKPHKKTEPPKENALAGVQASPSVTFTKGKGPFRVGEMSSLRSSQLSPSAP